MFERPDSHAAQVAANARVDQLAALLRDVYDRLQLDLDDPDTLRAIETTASYLWGVTVGCSDDGHDAARMRFELALHHTAFMRLAEVHR